MSYHKVSYNFLQSGPIWARLTGFPSWPARYCSPYEELCLRVKKSPKPGSAPIAVSFLGSSCLFALNE